MTSRVWAVLALLLSLAFVAVLLFREDSNPVAPPPTVSSDEVGVESPSAEVIREIREVQAIGVLDPPRAESRSEPRPIDRVAASMRVVHGRVVDTGDQPVPDVRLRLEGGASSTPVVSDASGRFTLELDPNVNPALVHVEGDGVVALLLMVPMELKEWTIVLPDLAWIDVVVIDERLAPVGGAAVTADYRSGEATGRTDAAGRVTLLVPIGGAATVRAKQPGFVMDRGDVGLEVDFDPSTAQSANHGSVQIKLLDADSLEVTLRTVHGNPIVLATSSIEWRGEYSGIVSATSDAEGVLRFEAVPRAVPTRTLSVQHPWIVSSSVDIVGELPRLLHVETPSHATCAVFVCDEATGERLIPDEIRVMTWQGWPSFSDLELAHMECLRKFRRERTGQGSLEAVRFALDHLVPCGTDLLASRRGPDADPATISAAHPFVIEVDVAGYVGARTEILWIEPEYYAFPVSMRMRRM